MYRLLLISALPCRIDLQAMLWPILHMYIAIMLEDCSSAPSMERRADIYSTQNTFDKCQCPRFRTYLPSMQ